MQAGNATAGGTGGSLYFRIGTGAGGPGSGAIYIGNQGANSIWPSIDISGPTTIYNSGPNTGTSLTINGGGTLAMRWDWDNINLVTSAVSSGNRILRFTGASQYQVRGSGTTSSTTALLVQNANASSSLVVLDNNYVGIGKSPSYPLDVAITNGGNASSGMFVSGVHPDGRAILYGTANTNTEQMLYWWHSGGIGVGTGDSPRGGAVSYVGDTSYYGPAHQMHFMETGTTFGPANIKSRLSIQTTTTNTALFSQVSNNSTNIESNTFTFTAKSHTFYTGTTTGNQSQPNQFTPLHLSTSGSVGIGTSTPSASLHVSGAILNYPITLPTASGTASIDCSKSNFFNLTLSGSYTLFLSASNIQPGQTINLRVIQPATSGSLNYGSQFKFAGGIPYSASATGSAVDIISFISYDTTTLYGSAIKNLS
jgi:hypothetical protein